MKHLLIFMYLYSYGILLHAQKLVKDIDGNFYHTITIGTQDWMAENLKVTHYNDGTIIPLVLDEGEWSLLTKGAYCVPEKNSKSYQNTFGVLYNFYTVINNRNLCPDGWRMPTTSEWETLINYLGGVEIAGGQMKKIDSNLWKVLIKNANNNSGFSAIPAGGRGRLGSIGDIGNYATWWSSTSADSIFAWHWGLYPDKNEIRFNPGHKTSGFSVRCIKGF